MITPTANPRSLLHPSGSAHSWSEDFGGENGNYQNRCIECATLFTGHKRRLVCKVCDATAREKWEAMSETERQESIARTRDAIAMFYAQNTDYTANKA